MKYIIFDTEGTDKINTISRVCQFSAIVLDDNLDVECIINEFCNLPMITDDNGNKVRMEMPEDAFEVHGLSNEKLAELSGGKEFPDIVEKYKHYFYGTGIMWIGYNVMYDIGAVNGTLSFYNKPKVNFGTKTSSNIKLPKNLNMNYCMMQRVNPTYKKMFNKYRPGNFSLTEVFTGLLADMERAEECALELFTEKKVNNLQEIKTHDALFDSYLTLALFVDTVINKDKYRQ